MDRAVTLRRVFSYLEDAERLGVFVRYPLSRGPSEIFDCVTCAHYRGLQTADREAFQPRCTVPDPVAREQVATPRPPLRSLPSLG